MFALKIELRALWTLGSLLLLRRSPGLVLVPFVSSSQSMFRQESNLQNTPTQKVRQTFSRVSAFQRTLQGSGDCCPEEQLTPLGQRQSGDLVLYLSSIAVERAQPGQLGGC